MELTLTPAYGRDPQSAAAARRSFESGEDWTIESINSPDRGRYCSLPELRRAGNISGVWLRYKRGERSTFVAVPQLST